MPHAIRFGVVATLLLHALQLVDGVSMCGNTRYAERSGSFATPNYHTPVDGNINCTYQISVPGRWVKLRWLEFDVDGSMPDCESNYVSVFLGCGSSEVELSKFCSRNAGKPHDIYSRDGCIKIKYYESTLGKKGFYVEYDSYPLTQSMNTKKCIRNRQLRNHEGVVISPDWPTGYNRSYCGWEIKLDGARKIMLNFMDVDLYMERKWKRMKKNCGKSILSDHLVVTSKGALSAKVEGYRKVFCSEDPFSVNLQNPNATLELQGKGLYRRSQRGFVVGYVSYAEEVGLWEGIDAGVIAGCVIAAIIIINAAIITLCYCCCCRKRQSKPTISKTINSDQAEESML